MCWREKGTRKRKGDPEWTTSYVSVCPDMSGHLHIHPIYELTMGGAGQPGHTGTKWGVRLDDFFSFSVMSGLSVRTNRGRVGGPVENALSIYFYL